MFNYFLFVGAITGIVIELLNFKGSNGIGLICYLLIMILYYQMFPRECKR